MKTLKQILLGLRYYKIHLTKYPFRTVFHDLLGPFVAGLAMGFQGVFVGIINYLGISLEYGLFLATGIAVSYNFRGMLDTYVDMFSPKRLKTVLFSENLLVVPLGRSLYVFVEGFIQFLMFMIPVVLLFNIDFVKLCLAYVIGTLILYPFTMSLGLLLAALSLVLRGRDLLGVYSFISRAFQLIIPVHFSIFVIPEPWKTLALLIPSMAGIEGLRMLLFGVGGVYLIVTALFSGIFFSVFSYFVLKKAMNFSRRKGLILLE